MIDRSEIVSAAKTLQALLQYNGEGDCPVTKEEAQTLWDEAYDLHGYAAVGGFLEVCANLKMEAGDCIFDKPDQNTAPFGGSTFAHFSAMSEQTAFISLYL